MKIWRSIAQILEQFQQSAPLTAFIKKAGIAFVIQILGTGLGYLLQVFLARVMGEREYGLYTYIFAWASIGGIICNVGLSGAVLRFIPEYSTQEDWGRFQGIIRGCSRFTLAIGIGIAVVGTLVVLAIDSTQPIANELAILLGIWTMPLLALESLQSNLFRGGRQMVAAYGPSKVLRPLLFIGGIGTILLWTHSRQITNQPVFIITILTYLILLGSQQLLIHRVLLVQGQPAQPIYDLRAWLRVSLPLLLIIGFMLILYQTDILMIGAILGPADVALYNAASKTSNLTTFVYTAVEAIAAPTIAALYAAGDLRQLQKMVTTMAHLVFWPTMLVTFGLLAGSSYILGMFGSGFIAAQWSLGILAIGQLVNATSGPGGYILDLTGHQNISVRVRCCSAILNIGLNYLLIPQFGITGAAMATATAIILDNIAIYIVTVKLMGIQSSIFSSLWVPKFRHK
jgi:O-antigen/teichoic acid export membrane protein